MKQYTFIVREWNVDFFIGLKSRILETTDATFQFLTMQHLAYEQLVHSNLVESEVYYLPEYFNSVEYNTEKYLGIDQSLHAIYGFGINRVYDLERFKPLSIREVIDFKVKQTLGLSNLFEKKSILVSLTMDHFVYVMAGLLNEASGGENFFIQPVGFPINANAVFSNPWRLKKVRSNILGNELEEYQHSLVLKPEESIHYMKRTTADSKSLLERVLSKVRVLKIKKIAKKYHGQPFTYLDNQLKNLFKERLIDNTNAWYNTSLTIEQINDCSENVKVFYFPLQLEPEMSTLAYSPFIRNQLEIIRLVSMTLRGGDLLLIKENPKMKGKRSQSFYDEIERYDNVRWAGYDINSREIIRVVFKTISVTGTACIEAACLGKMSLIVGYSPWRKMLIQDPLCERPLIEIEAELYQEHSLDEIISKVRIGYSDYEKSLFLCNLIPHVKNAKWNCAQLRNVDEAAEKVFRLLEDNLCVES